MKQKHYDKNWWKKPNWKLFFMGLVIVIILDLIAISLL